MRINAEFDKEAFVIPDDSRWIRSPESGVDRLMLDRIGDEIARATSIVRYAPGSSFPRHEHARGEEFLVLEGVFSDESGDYPAGTYVRNPPGSGHAPFSTNGCRILVKLRQFDPADLQQFSVDTRDAQLWGSKANELPLHQFGRECVRMLRVNAGETFAIEQAWCGTELLTVSGAIKCLGRSFPAESWLRFPVGSADTLLAEEDSLLWVKTGHLEP